MGKVNRPIAIKFCRHQFSIYDETMGTKCECPFLSTTKLTSATSIRVNFVCNRGLCDNAIEVKNE